MEFLLQTIFSTYELENRQMNIILTNIITLLLKGQVNILVNDEKLKKVLLLFWSYLLLDEYKSYL